MYILIDKYIRHLWHRRWIKRSMVQNLLETINLCCDNFYNYYTIDIPHDLLKFSLLLILPNFLMPLNLLKSSHAFLTLDNSLLTSLAIFYYSQLSTIRFLLLYNISICMQSTTSHRVFPTEKLRNKVC
jgi:hypothetical protein